MIGSFFAYSLVLISLIDTTPAPTTAHLATWTLAFVLEVFLLGASFSFYTNVHRDGQYHLHGHSGKNKLGLRYGMTNWELIEVFIDILRIVCLLALSLFYLIFVVSRNAKIRQAQAASSDGGPTETTGLLSEPTIEEPQLPHSSSDDIEAQQQQAQAADSQAAESPSREAQDADGDEGAAESQRAKERIAEEEDTDPESSATGTGKTDAADFAPTNQQTQSDGSLDGGQAETATDERQPLRSVGPPQAERNDPSTTLNGSALNGHAKGYGTISQDQQKPSNDAAKPPVVSKEKEEPSGWERPKEIPARSWWEYIRGYSVFFPYLWPANERKLQLQVVISVFIMVLQRVLNIAVPTVVGGITDALAGEKGKVHMPWGLVCLFVFLRFMQGGNGLLSAIRSIVWLPVSQYCYRALSTASFEHVHSLSLDFHLGKKTGEVTSALGKGASINNFLENVTFQVLPMLVDLSLAIVFFIYKFDSYYALTISIVTFWYIYITIRMAQWRSDIRRQMVNADREEDAVKNDSMLSYETVKYFNAERWEFDRYKDAVNKYLAAEFKVSLSLSYMNVAQNSIFMVGLLVMCFILSYQISIGNQTVGQFAILVTYMAQLQQPLNFFGTFYRVIQSAMINSERMLELFKEQPTVVDGPDAKPLATCEGRIDFEDLHFAYDQRKPALNGLDFNIKPGTTVAFVGESGGGKSTVFRLLFRFYNPTSGRILVDGHDVQSLTIDSLRKKIGVVPQDTVLFNESIMYNLKYANQDATDEDVYNACRAASIHERILSFPEGYKTAVGERGLRLSGGEKQRVAIARTIIKNPRIILLDEATAALDTETEQHIQEALSTLSHGRTMLVIAHRLSTITLADQIVVLHKGKVAETGTHDELLARNGKYASMWDKQVRAQRAAEEAKKAKDTAEKLRLEMEARSPSENGSAEPSINVTSYDALDDGGGKPAGHP